MSFDFALSRPLEPSLQVLHPGDVGVGTRGDRLETLLGSCIAIALTDPRRTVGAMCHFVHRGDGPDARYADAAFAAMAAALRRLGIEPRLCEAHLAGGGHMFPALGPRTAGDVGAANAAYALALLAAHGVPVRSRSLGGAVYRRVAWTVGDDAPQVECVPLEPGKAGPP